jgi:PPOX class probable F420-dependent enzyme
MHPQARALLESDALVHLVTLNPDGSPQVSIVWAGLDGEDIVCGHMSSRRKTRNAERDPRVSLSIEGAGVNQWGLKEYLVVHGRATVQAGGAAPLLQRLAHVYLGPDVVFPPGNPPADAGLVLRITPERFSGVGPWAA